MANWGDNFRRGNVPLRVIDPVGSVKVFSLAVAGLKIGSARDAELSLDDPHVAPQHCRIIRRGSDWLLIDHGSDLGTTVNHRRIAEPTVLAEGDRIGVGSHIIEVAPARLQVDPRLVAEKIRYGGGLLDDERDHDAEIRRRLAESAAAWDQEGRPTRQLPDASRLRSAARLDAVAPLEPLTRTWALAGATRCRRWQGARWLASGLVPGLLLARALLAAAPEAAAPGTTAPEPARPTVAAPAPSPPVTLNPSRALPSLALDHEVIPGETLAEIAALYAVQPAWIERWNPKLVANQPLRPGMLLRVETDRLEAVRRERRCVTLTKSESWDALARRLGTDVMTLRGYNPRSPDILRAGEVVTTFVRKRATDLPAVELAPPEVDDLATSRGKPTLADPVDQDLAPFPFSPYYELRCPRHAFASSHTITNLLAALTDLRGRYDGQIIVGDLSREEGGALGPHVSHQTGRDVDIWLPVLGGCYRATAGCDSCGSLWCRPLPDEIDWAATWDLIVALRGTGAVQNVFLDRSLHPKLRAAARAAGVPGTEVDATIHSEPGVVALVTHSDYHTRHVHVRFRCGPRESGCRG